MKRMKAVVALAVALTFATAGCGTKVFYAVKYKQKLELGKDKFLIMPIDFHGFPSKMKTMLEITIFASFMAKFAGNGISLQPIKKGFEAAGFNNLSWQMAHGCYHRASFHKDPHLKGPHMAWLRTIPGMLVKFVGWVVTALKAAGVNVDFKPRYVLSAHVDRQGSVFGGKLTKYRVIGCILDTQDKMIVAATWYTRTTANNKAAFVGAFAGLPGGLIKAFKPIWVPKEKK